MSEQLALEPAADPNEDLKGYVFRDAEGRYLVVTGTCRWSEGPYVAVREMSVEGDLMEYRSCRAAGLLRASRAR